MYRKSLRISKIFKRVSRKCQTPKCGCGNRNSTRCVAVADAVSVAVYFKTATSELFFYFCFHSKY
eukprot:UN01275